MQPSPISPNSKIRSSDLILATPPMRSTSESDLRATMLDQIVCRFIEHAVNDEPLGDVADRAQWFTEIYQAEALQKVMREETLQERKALQRKEQGLQTQCEQCGQPIPEERLVVLPSATRCVPCQSGREKSNRKK